jgi:hypothetical protein
MQATGKWIAGRVLKQTKVTEPDLGRLQHLIDNEMKRHPDYKLKGVYPLQYIIDK